MFLKMFAVYDTKSECYGNPIFLKTIGEAIRGFTDVANGSDSTIGKYPEDFTLFELGSYDDQKASFVLHHTPISIGKANEFVKSSYVPPVNPVHVTRGNGLMDNPGCL